jgi:hypothetical protein
MQEHQYWTTLSDWSHAHENFHQQLQALDENPSELVTLLNKQRDHRLGHRFETLLTYWLKHNGRHKILAQNLQIQDGNRTIGEFDFIVEDTLSNTVQHWEVACKFYLGVKNTNLTEHWVGPMLKDRLDIKHNAMQTRQSKLSKHPAAQQKLKQLNIHIDEHICLMKGRLFHPTQQATQMPEVVSSSHQRGEWIHADRFVEHFNQLNFQWLPLKKDQWMASQQFLSSETYYDNEGILNYFLDKQNPRPLCLAGFLPDKSTRHEVTRLFLVAKDWAKDLDIVDNTPTH